MARIQVWDGLGAERYNATSRAIAGTMHIGTPIAQPPVGMG